jgi:hypothetical protein
MALLINATVSIDPVQSRAFTTERDDSGFSRQSMTVTGYTDRDRANLAAAKETARQLNEMANNHHYRTVHVADSEDSQYDGLYELTSAGVTATPTTSNSSAALFAVSVTLRRLGGGGADGHNLTKQVAMNAYLNANSYGIAGLFFVPTPVGGQPLTAPGGVYSLYSRITADGAIYGLMLSGSEPITYVSSGADVNKGECKAWDMGTVGSAASTWARVWSPDHSFSDDRLIAIDNGLVRVGAASTTGFHFIQVWDQTNGAWANVASSASDGDYVLINGTATHSSLGSVITELSPWRVVVTWSYSATVTPYLWTKTVTVERGKSLAQIVITPVSATTIAMRPMNTTFWLSARTADTSCAYHSTVETSATLSTATNNVLMGFNATTDDVLCVAAVATTTPAAAVTTSVQRITATAATSLTVWTGGLAYDCTKAWAEAESGTLSGGATTTSAFGNDSGNSVVVLDTLNEQVALPALSSPPTGVRVMAWFRIASSLSGAAGNVGDRLTLTIHNLTTGSPAAQTSLLATNTTFFSVANTLVWAAVECTTWNGMDTLYPYAVKSLSATAQQFYVDEVIMLTLSANGLDKAANAAYLAMTDVYFWDSPSRLAW